MDNGKLCLQTAKALPMIISSTILAKKHRSLASLPLNQYQRWTLMYLRIKKVFLYGGLLIGSCHFMPARICYCRRVLNIEPCLVGF